MDVALTTRTRLKLLLIVTGGLGGALIGAALTLLGKIVAGAPEPATAANYVWNMVALGAMGALFAPVVTWSALRRVPLWRTMGEPVLAGIAGAALGTLLGSSVAFITLAPIAMFASIWRLNVAYRGEPRRFAAVLTSQYHPDEST